MTAAQYRSRTAKWFAGKVGKTKRIIINNAGDIIHYGDKVTILGKSRGFRIRSKTTGVEISRVDFQSIDFDFEQYK